MSFYFCWSGRTVASEDATVRQEPRESLLLLLLSLHFLLFFNLLPHFPPCTYLVLSEFILAALCSSFLCLFPPISPTDLLSHHSFLFLVLFSLLSIPRIINKRQDWYFQAKQIWNLRDQHRVKLKNCSFHLLGVVFSVGCWEPTVPPCDFCVRNKYYILINIWGLLVVRDQIKIGIKKVRILISWSQQTH